MKTLAFLLAPLASPAFWIVLLHGVLGLFHAPHACDCHVEARKEAAQPLHRDHEMGQLHLHADGNAQKGLAIPVARWARDLSPGSIYILLCVVYAWELLVQHRKFSRISRRLDEITAEISRMRADLEVPEEARMVFKPTPSQ